jgi:hypothetical protein
MQILQQRLQEQQSCPEFSIKAEELDVGEMIKLQHPKI